jgi:hypothetical protein
MTGVDPETQTGVPLFNPRRDNWAEHFLWLEGGVTIQGITAIGRATCVRLDLNDMRYPEADSIRATRRFWIQTGLHPR